MKNILIVEDDITFALMLKTWLGKKGFGADTAGSVAGAREAIGKTRYDIVLTDMRLPDQDGIYLLQWIADNRPEVPSIVMTSYADIRTAVMSMKLGASDYISKPVNPEELLVKINEALEKGTSGAATGPTARETDVKKRTAAGSSPAGNRGNTGNDTETGWTGFVEGQSDAARRLYEYVRLVAPTNMSVLINGSSGTGKEHIAHMIHHISKRSGAPFVAIDCGAIPRDLAASEFFGHVKGSFTGAVSDKTGAFEAANGGTLFLDEIGNLGYETQIQLLRALQERRIRPVGSNREIEVDIRLVCATNENLEKAISSKSFREDLFHRINEFTLRMPDLREQGDDIMLYADFFLDQANRELEKQITGFEPEAASRLRAYHWPGNLRQLKNTVRCATLLAQSEFITCRDLPSEIVSPAAEPQSGSLSLHDHSTEADQIRRALETAGGNKSKAAKLLGIDRKTLYNKLRLHGIE